VGVAAVGVAAGRVSARTVVAVKACVEGWDVATGADAEAPQAVNKIVIMNREVKPVRIKFPPILSV